MKKEGPHEAVSNVGNNFTTLARDTDSDATGMRLPNAFPFFRVAPACCARVVRTIAMALFI